ncbi:alkaline phosphatase [soil metagenome]
MPPTAHTTRRDFLKTASIASAVFGAPMAQLSAAETRRAGQNAGAPRNIIFMVSDGMNHGALSLAQSYLARTSGEATHWMRLYREHPAVRCLADTASADSLVPDSAAAASAWGCGHRVPNGRINVGADGTRHAPLQAKLKEAGILTGLVSTATITHATPAGFAATVDSRNKEKEIAQQYADFGVPVLLGGGRKFFDESLLETFRRNGHEVVQSRDELRAASTGAAKPILGTFADGYLPYALDWAGEETLQREVPPLDEMARFAVERLSALPNEGWFLMVEGARIDHCGHANDAAGSIHEQLAFDQAVGAMLEHVSGRDDTLLVVTTDHGCGGLQLNGVNAPGTGTYGGTDTAFDRLGGFKMSLEAMSNRASGLSGPPLQEFLKSHTGLDLDDAEVKAAQGLKSHDLARIFAPHHGVSWTGGNHTGDLVEFCALGPGSHLFPAFHRANEIHDILLEAYGLA